MNYNNDVGELDNFCSQCLLVINAVDLHFKINDLKIALHALRNNCHYIDIEDMAFYVIY